MSNFLQQLKRETNKSFTENGAETLSSSLNPLVDFFAQGGATRNNQELGVKLFLQAFAYDRQKAVRLLFYMRDIRGGQGERALFRNCLQYLGTVEPNVAQKIAGYIPEYGRYDDLFSLPEEIYIPLIKEQLVKDYQSDNPSLLAKWMPSENTSSKETRALAKKIRTALDGSSKEYRQLLSKLRAKIKLVEQKLSAREFTSIDYSKVPSQASLKYRKAFYRNDEKGYQAYLDSVEKGENKINAFTLYPYQLYDAVNNGDVTTADSLWKALPDYTRGKNAIVVADVSGSMSGRPMSISVSLALYFAERNKGVFHNHYITFSGEPVLQEVKGKTLRDKMNFIQRENVGYNTNLNKVFKLLVDTAVKNNIEPEEMPDTIYVISDMEFDCPDVGGTNHQAIKNMFAGTKYKIPNLVYWNVDALQKNVPVEQNEEGVTLVSGASPSTFELVVENKTPNDLMEDVINSERYSSIVL